MSESTMIRILTSIAIGTMLLLGARTLSSLEESDRYKEQRATYEEIRQLLTK